MWINRKILTLLGCLASPFFAHGEDIDIFSGIQPNGEKPNLMVLLDNSAAWDATVSFTCPGFTVPSNNTGKAVGFEQCALYNAVQSIGSSQALLGNINMGLMLFGAGSTNGGTLKDPAAAPYTMPVMDSTGITNFASTVAALDRNNDKSNGSAIGAAMQEVWAYYKGDTGLSGTSYTQHFNSACQRNFVVYIANANNFGKPQDQGQTAFNALVAAGATTAQQTQIAIPSPYNKYQANWADEWARFMYQTDMSATFTGNQNITTYTIIVTDGNNPDYVQFLKSMAAYGGGKAFVVTLGDMNALVQALLQIFNEVQGVNTAFASASLPVSTNAQGINLNQVFLGVFRPDSAPRWQGNLKQYKLGVDPTNNSETILVDANGIDAISSAGTGFISPNAVSFWTSKNASTLPDSAGGFWVNDPQGASDGFDSADGEVVEKGGAHQRIRLSNLKVDYAAALTSSSRQLYTCTTGCSSGSSLSTTPFATSNGNITATLLGTSAPSVSISSIKRSDTTNKATVTLASVPSPALSNGQTVTISGASNFAFNGSFSITVLDSTHFTIPLPATNIIPPTPATGTFTADVPATNFQITSLTRNGTTATATTASAHGYLTGQTVTIAGATQSEYNGAYTIAVTGTTSFTYTISPSPAAPTTGGTATKGAESFAFTAANVKVNTLGATTQNVTVTNSASGNTPPKTWVIGNSVTISGVVPTAYNGTWTITNVGSGCTNGTNNKSFCFTMSTSPVTPATTASTITVGTPASSLTLSSLTHVVSTCAVGASPTYTSSGSATVNATATTSVASHGLSSGELLTISGTPASNEGAYNVANVAITVTGANTFTYPITLAPPCQETTAGMLATPSGVDRDTLIRWVRGEDNANDEPSPDGSKANINIRPSVHGDVLHSRPAVVNYGGSTGVVVFYGSNDGVFRAVNGNQVNPVGSSLPSPGNELWGFIPQEFFPRLNRLRNNSPQIKLSTTPTGISPTPQPKDYFFDGSTGIYRDTAGNVYLYLTSRRGARMIYALDVTNPMAPKFMWKHTNTDGGFSELGQTWSQPRTMKVKGYSNPVVVIGAGYDPAEDAQPATADTMGRGIFILDALDGSIVWQANKGGATSTNICAGTPCQLQGMTYAIPSDVAPVDRDFDGKVDRIYVPDLGGNIWRIDLEPSTANYTPAFWQAELLASVGGTGTGDKRKIFYPPSVVASTGYDAVVFATGDREHPMSSDAAASVKNRFYMVKDFNQGKDGSKNADGTDLTPVTDTSSTTAFGTSSNFYDATSLPYDNSLKGFYINLTSTGEKSVNKPLVVGNTVYFATNSPLAPDPNTCQANLGTAQAYQVDWFTGQSSKVVLPGGGMPPSPVEAIVPIGDGTRDVIIGGGVGVQGAKGPFGAGSNPNAPVSTRKRSFWYEKR